MFEKDISNKIKRLSLHDSFSTLAITCYDDQLPKGTEALYEAIKTINSNDYQIIAICHDRSGSKLHYHIIVRVPVSTKRKKVSAMLKLLNIKFRDGIDDQLVQNRALESCGEFPAYATYLLHQSVSAVRLNKAKYDMEDFITNLSQDEIETILEGYNVTKHAIKKGEFASIQDQVRDAGYNLKSYDELVKSFAIAGLTSTQEASLKKAYKAGLESRINEHEKITRLALCILYPLDVTLHDKYVIDEAIKIGLGDKNYSTTTGKDYINFDHCTDALVFFDYNLSIYGDLDNNLLKKEITTINKPVASKKSIWAGQDIIYTTQYECDHNGQNIPFIAEQKCLCCTVENNKLKLVSIPQSAKIINKEEADIILSHYHEFKIKFDDALEKDCQVVMLSLDDFNI